MKNYYKNFIAAATICVIVFISLATPSLAASDDVIVSCCNLVRGRTVYVDFCVFIDNDHTQTCFENPTCRVNTAQQRRAYHHCTMLLADQA